MGYLSVVYGRYSVVYIRYRVDFLWDKCASIPFKRFLLYHESTGRGLFKPIVSVVGRGPL